jgi:hypothetical protein
MVCHLFNYNAPNYGTLKSQNIGNNFSLFQKLFQKFLPLFLNNLQILNLQIKFFYLIAIKRNIYVDKT